jgi:hypothetical protein
MEVSLRGLVLLRLFQYHRRVLDAWVVRCLPLFRRRYQEKDMVRDRRSHVPAPLVLDGQDVAAPTPAQLGAVFARGRGCLVIWGEGGAGKTSLACQLGHWAMADTPAERLCRHRMLPVLLAQELAHTSAGSPAAALVEAVRGQLQAYCDDMAPPSAELVEHLLRRRRILVIVDCLSELGPDAREAIRPGRADFPAYALVVTSREAETLDGVPHSVARLLGQRLSRAA